MPNYVTENTRNFYIPPEGRNPTETHLPCVKNKYICILVPASQAVRKQNKPVPKTLLVFRYQRNWELGKIACCWHIVKVSFTPSLQEHSARIPIPHKRMNHPTRSLIPVRGRSNQEHVKLACSWYTVKVSFTPWLQEYSARFPIPMRGRQVKITLILRVTYTQ